MLKENPTQFGFCTSTVNFSQFRNPSILPLIVSPSSSTSSSQISILHKLNLINNSGGTQLLNPINNSNVQLQTTRNIIKFSLRRGKRKTCKAVLRRFKRLDWGIWLRTRCGRHKKMWKKTAKLKRRLRQHVFVNSTQSWLLDKFVTKYWRRPHHFIDDPYRPYHSREEYFATRKNPIKYY